MSEASAREWSSEIQDIGDKIMTLTLMKAQELGDYLKDVYGVEAAAVPIMAAGPAAAAGSEGRRSEGSGRGNEEEDRGSRRFGRAQVVSQSGRLTRTTE
jgi:ribosomal protein L7/L12